MPKVLDLKGKTMGLWTILEKGENLGKRTTWICKCKCGTIKQVATEVLSKGQSKTCGCSSYDYRKELNFYEDLTGMKFGRLTVLEFAERKNKMITWKCQCDCGNTAIVYASLLKKGHTTSCGCYKKERNQERSKTHGKSKTDLYHVWVSMKSRCLCKTNKSYKHYGERGIKICKEWEQYPNFEEWAFNEGYSKGLTIERIDVNGNYEPSNCKWATYSEQSKNRRNTVRIEYKGKNNTMSEWANIFGINHSTIQYHIKKNNVEEFFDRLAEQQRQELKKKGFDSFLLAYEK